MVRILINECIPLFIFSLCCLLMHFMFSFSLEKVLEAITTAGEWRGIERFSPIVQGLRDRSVQLQVSAFIATDNCLLYIFLYMSLQIHTERDLCIIFMTFESTVCFGYCIQLWMQLDTPRSLNVMYDYYVTLLPINT